MSCFSIFQVWGDSVLQRSAPICGLAWFRCGVRFPLIYADLQSMFVITGGLVRRVAHDGSEPLLVSHNLADLGKAQWANLTLQLLGLRSQHFKGVYPWLQFFLSCYISCIPYAIWRLTGINKSTVAAEVYIPGYIATVYRAWP